MTPADRTCLHTAAADLHTAAADLHTRRGRPAH